METMIKTIKDKITEKHLHQPVLYENAGEQQIGIIVNFPSNMKDMIEICFRTDENPQLLNINTVNLITIKN